HIDKDLTAHTQFVMESSGQKAVQYRKKANDNASSKWMGSLFKDKVDFEEGSVEVNNIKEVDDLFSAKANYKTDITLTNGAGLYFFNPFVLNEFSESPFKADSRHFPIQFPYTHSFKYLCSVTIPEGYELAEIPKSVRIKLPNN